MFSENTQEEIDSILENETLQNKNESWNKLNKTVKLQKLSAFAEKYGNEQKYTQREINQLKQFFLDALERGKLQKTKEVIYDKNIQSISDIPGLFLHPTNHNFTLRIMDTKRVSTLKSLAPKRISEKNKTILKETLNIENKEFV
jgi:TnpA family transposase